MRIDPGRFESFLAEAFPDARCSLRFSNPFEALVSVMLSAQTADESVNKVTPALFRDYPDAFAMAKAPLGDLENHLKTLGLYRAKAKHLQALSHQLAERHGGAVPATKEALTSLPGVGVKTANVVLAECFAVPSIPVDTHVARVSKRAGYAKEGDAPEEIEKKLERLFPKEKWIPLHHRIIAFGRATCHARNPECASCGLASACPYKAKASRKADK